MEVATEHTPEGEGLLDLRAASAAFGLSRSRLYALAVSGEIPSSQLNGKGKLLFRRSDIEALLKPRAKASR
jgi:predicted DNA-binding transcriptional regulator AlpA